MVSVGDTYNGLSSVANNGYLTIQPTGTREAVIHNIYCANISSGAIELYYTDGATPIKFDSDSANGTRQGIFLHVTNIKYVTVKNAATGGAVLMGFDGMYTHI